MVDFPDGLFAFVPSAQIEFSNEFSVPFSDTKSSTIVAGGYTAFNFYFLDASKIYQLHMITVGCSASRELLAIVQIDGKTYHVGGFDRNLAMELINNPALKLASSNVLQVYVYNYSASNASVYVTVSGAKFKKPIGFVQPPVALFTIDKYVASLGATVTFTDLSTGTVVSYDYDFDDGSAHSSNANPTHDYSSKGQYVPLQTVSNLYGSDYYSLFTPIGIANTSDYTGFTEVDAGGFLTITAGTIAFANLSTSDVAYAYYDGGANYYNNIDFSFELNISVCDDGGRTAVFRLSNVVGAHRPFVANDLYVSWERYGAVHYLFLRLYDGAAAEEFHATSIVSLGTTYYIRVRKVYGYPTIYFDIYSDSTYSTPVASHTITTAANITTRWRYLYGLSSDSAGGAGTITGEVRNLRQISP